MVKTRLIWCWYQTFKHRK